MAIVKVDTDDKREVIVSWSKNNNIVQLTQAIIDLNKEKKLILKRIFTLRRRRKK